MCAADEKKLGKIRRLASEQLEREEQARVLFFTPEELISYFTVQGDVEVSQKEKIKGFKVKVRYPSPGASEGKGKRQVVAEMILKSFRRLKKEK